MADFGIGIGSFLDGFAGGVKLRQGMDDAAYQEKARARQQTEWSQADQDRARRIESENANAAFQARARERQSEDWNRQDALRQAQDDAYKAGAEARGQAVEKSIIPVPTQGPTRNGQPLPGGYKAGEQMFRDKGEARKAAEAQADGVFNFINGKHVDDVVQKAIQAGNMQLADAYPKWLQDQKVQAGVRHFADAVGKFSTGDVEGSITSLNAAYNARGYLDNGYTAKVGSIQRDANGKPQSVDVEFVNDRNGQKYTQSGVDVNQLFHGSLNLLSPDKVAEFGIQTIKDEQSAKAAEAKAQRDLQLDIAKKRAEAQIKRDEEAGAGSNPYAAGKFNETQGKAATYADRMAEADAIIASNEGINSGLTGAVGGLLSNTLPAGVGNLAKSSQRQQVEQGQRNFINSILRRESGAAISEGEFASARQQYFPQPGDSAEVIAQKRANRVTAIKGIMREAGPSYRPPQSWADPNNTPGASSQLPQASSAPHGRTAVSPAATGAVLAQARAAIAKGANPAVVAERLRGMGVDPGGLQ